jgi:hypothetical protein
MSATRLYDHFLLEDIYDYVKMGYWLVLPYSALRGHPRLRIAPSGVVPQRERRRILQRIAYCNTTFGPPLLAKIDMADGYYRIPLSADASLQLAVVLPTDDGDEPLLGLPLSLPMGWSLSPPFF